MLLATASVAGASLPGSNFEIDADANLKVDLAPPSIDWLVGGAGTPMRSGVIVKVDKPTGATDDSFGQGTKEDTAVPTVVDGSIPPNKSDLKSFGVYVEKTAAGSFLNLFWTRVQDPQGTTNMDFEFNQSQTLSSNGVTPVRTTGDLLITYDLSRGGTVATLSLRRWTGSAWGPATLLTGAAIGSINTTTIPATESGGLGPLDPRTFGEASIDLAAVFTAGRCQSLGSAYLKSRSSDSFTAALKDFIAPAPVSLTNCGSALVKKTDLTNGNPVAGAVFSVSPGSTDADGVTAPSTTMTEYPGGLHCTDNLLFGQHTITEVSPPPDYEPADPASQTVTVTDNGTCAARIAAGSPPDATFQNAPSKGAIQVTKTAKHADSSGATSPNLGATFTVKQGATTVGTITTDPVTGKGCLGGLAFGSYTVMEMTAPTGYAIDTDVEAAQVSAKGDCSGGFVNVSFQNTPLTDITVSVNSQVAGGTASDISCTGLTPTPADGSAGFNDTSETYVGNAPGTYTCTIVIDP